MKKFVIAIFTLYTTLSLNAQDLISKIPSSASAVISFKGKNITNLMSVEEFSNSKLGTMLNKALSKETRKRIPNISESGINFNNNSYYFNEAKNYISTHCFLIPLDNEEKFINSFSKTEKKRIIKEGNISYSQVEYNGTVVMWNANTLIVVLATDLRLNLDHGYYTNTDTEDSQYNNSSKENMYISKKNEFFRDLLTKTKKIIAGTYASKSILSNTNYIKSIGKGKGKEEASIWVNDFTKIYKQAAPSYMLDKIHDSYRFMNIDKLYSGFSFAATLNFEEDKAIINTHSTFNNEMADIYKQIYNGKANKRFTKYINEDQMLGYISLNLSTEGMLKAYPNLISNLIETNSSEIMSETEIIALSAKLFSMLIDEEETAKIFRGDMFLSLTNLSKKQVTYTDYEYDADFNYKKVEKTKSETVPDFMFMFTSEEQELFDRLVKIALKEDTLEAIDGIYRIKELPSSTPFNMFLMYKDDTVFLGSSLKDMTAIKSGKFVAKLSGEHKRNITKNASSIYINEKKIISEIPVESFPRELKNKMEFLTSNTEDITFNFYKVKGNSMKGEVILKTPTKGHKNSFAYFINVIDTFMK